MEDIKCGKCGAVNNYYTEVKANNNVARCSVCDAFIKNIAYAEPSFFVGKYKGKPIKEIEDMGYLKWALKEMKLSENMRKAISNRIADYEFQNK